MGRGVKEVKKRFKKIMYSSGRRKRDYIYFLLIDILLFNIGICCASIPLHLVPRSFCIFGKSLRSK